MSSFVSDALAQALGSQRGEGEDRTSERILDAAVGVAAEVGLRNLTMDAVAGRAGVGRMTVYRRFEGRDELVAALAERETRRALETIGTAVNPADPVVDQLADGFVAAMGLLRDHPLFRRMTLVDPQGLLTALIENRGAHFVTAREFVAAHIRAGQDAGTINSGLDPAERAEVIIRLGFSFALIESTVLPLGDEAGMRDFARRLLAPLLTV